MFLISTDKINAEFDKSSWRTIYKRYADCIEKSENDQLSSEDKAFVSQFEDSMLGACESLSMCPDIYDYYHIRSAMTANNDSPENIDDSLFCYRALAKECNIPLPACYNNLDEEALHSHGYIPAITKIVSNDPDTVIFFNDGTSVNVHCEPDEAFDAEKGIYLALLKKTLGAKHLHHLFNLIQKASVDAKDKTNKHTSRSHQ